MLETLGVSQRVGSVSFQASESHLAHHMTLALT